MRRASASPVGDTPSRVQAVAECIDPLYHLTVTLRIAAALVAYRPSIQLHDRVLDAPTPTCVTTGTYSGSAEAAFEQSKVAS